MKIGNKTKAILMTRSDSWTTPVMTFKSGTEEDFCLNCTNETCKGYCQAFKDFKKKNRKRK